MSRADFRSAKDLGKPLLDDRYRERWERGVSFYDSLDYAEKMARRFRFQLGRYVVPVTVPRRAVEVIPWPNDPHHVTLSGTPDELLGLVSGPATRIEEEPL